MCNTPQKQTRFEAPQDRMAAYRWCGNLPAPPPEPTRLQRQLDRDLKANLADLPTTRDWGCKSLPQ
jgi:hypothetical protein